MQLSGTRAEPRDPEALAWNTPTAAFYRVQVRGEQEASSMKKVMRRVHCAPTSPQGTALVLLRFAIAMLSGAALGGNLEH